MPLCKIIRLNFIPYININPQWIKDPNVRTKNTKLIEENIGRSFMALNLAMIS
jgi:hypothetical protein